MKEENEKVRSIAVCHGPGYQLLPLIYVQNRAALNHKIPLGPSGMSIFLLILNTPDSYVNAPPVSQPLGLTATLTFGSYYLL